MHALATLLVAAATILPNVAADAGRTLTSWDCCKPACAWNSNLQQAGATGSVMVCDKGDQPLSANQATSITSGCSEDAPSNAGFLCSDYQPRPVAEDLAYGFVITDGIENCCKCFELQWTDGPAVGKRMQVQSINEGGSTENGRRDFIILSPGGGVGPNKRGCDTQFGYDWGRQYGGVTRMEDCQSLPENMQAGCYWRWNWARGDVNTWPLEWKRITCPEALSSISGCSA